MNRFIRELRRREVFRTAGLYVGICWVLIEVASILLPTFDAPEWIMRTLVIATFVGFPVMLVLSWVYDVTDHGIEVQAEPTDTVVAPLGSRKMDFVVIGVLTVALLLSLYLNFFGGSGTVEELEPVSVLIADFDNQTGNPLFDGLLEQALNIGVEGAPNVTAYLRNSALQVGTIIQPGADKLVTELAQLVAVREGIQYVLSGLIAPDGPGFDISLRALDASSGEDAFDVSVGAKDANGVLVAVSELSQSVREEFGDTTLDQPGATDGPFTAASLEAAKAFTEALDLEFYGNPEEAVQRYEIATELDPNFGRAYAGWALSEYRMGNTDKAEALWQKALSLMDTMTERERLRTLGVYYATVTRNFENAVQSFSELVEKYPADAAGHNNLAVAAFLSLDFETASREGRAIMEIYPNSQLYQSNFALYAMYSGEFEAAAEVAQKLISESPGYGTAYLPLAIANIVNGDFDAAKAAYADMAQANSSDHRESTATMGLGDLEAYRGDFPAAIAILEPAIQAEREAERQNAAAAKSIALAEVLLASGDTEAAAGRATEAMSLSTLESVKVAAGRVFVASGDLEAAGAIAKELGARLQSQSRAYGQMLRGMIARESGNYVEAVDLLRGAVDLADLWLVRYELGQSYLAAGYHAEALDEFTDAMARRGEASAVFLDDTPSIRYLAPLHYWIGRARQELGMGASAKDSYQAFLALRPDGGPLADDARQRMQ